MKKALLSLPLLLALQGCSMIDTKDMDLVSTPEKTAVTVVGAALGGYLGAQLGEDVADSAGETLGLLGGTYVGMLAPAFIWENFASQE